MRENKKSNEKLKIFTVYTVTGLNFDRFIEKLKNSGITLYDVKKVSPKKLRVTVNYSDNEKFFAISEDLCYNVKREGEKGLFKFGLFLMKNAGILIGAFIFTLFSAFSDDFIYKIEYYGSGKADYRIAETYLKENGAERFSRFSSLDTDRLSDGLTAVSEKFSFAECVKYGNVLKVNLVKAEEKGKTLNADKDRLVSDVNGVITSLSVYRGTAQKNVGDTVYAGDTIVDGYATVREKTVKVGVIAVAVIDARETYSYYSDKDGQEDIFLILVEESVEEREITATSAEVIPSGDGFLYTVTVIYRRVLYSG